MFKSKLVKSMVIGMCFTILSAGVAFAAEDIVEPVKAQDGEAQILMAQDEQSEGYKAALEKQKEIDKYLFVEHADEIKQQGFTVTYTGPTETYVEIGITPFSEENADYLYEIFGKEGVNVVEDQQAVLLTGAHDEEIFTTTIAIDDEINTTTAAVDNDEIYTTTSAELAENEESNSSPSSTPWIYALGAVVLLGGSAFVIHKQKAAGKRR